MAVGKSWLGLVLVLLQSAEALQAVGPVWPVPTDLWQPNYPSLPSDLNYIYLEVLGWESTNYTYIQANSSLAMQWEKTLLTVTVQGFETWTGFFQPMQGLKRLERGYYEDVIQYPGRANKTVGAMNWVQGTYPETYWEFEGWFAVDSIQYSGASLTSVDLRFELEGYLAARGAIHWSINDHSKPQGPIKPPTDLWQPPKHALPVSGNYAYMENLQPGYNFTYNSSNALINCSFDGNQTQIEVRGNQYWWGIFQGMYSLLRLEPGYYAGPLQYPDFNPAFGGFAWSNGDWLSNEQAMGWFVIDEITYGQSIKLRFAQYTTDSYYTPGTIFGAVYWRKDNVVTPPPPVYPPPAHLWQPATDVIPASGNYIYLESNSTEEYNCTLTRYNALFSLSTSDASISVAATTYIDWQSQFVGRYHMKELAKGYYGSLPGPPFNPVTGGLYVSNSPETADGWFVVDEISYSGTKLQKLTLRFEATSSYDNTLTHGAIQWSVLNPTTLIPVYPVPSDLWLPPSSVLSIPDNYVYLEEYQSNYTYTSATSELQFNYSAGLLSVSVDSYEQWTGCFKAIKSLPRLEEGYYSLLPQYYENYNEELAAMSWMRQYSSYYLMGWFAVDAVSYIHGNMNAIYLRFAVIGNNPEQVLYRGALNWTNATPQDLPTPVYPPPADLWQPSTSVLPSSGNYAYLEDQFHSYIYTPSNAQITLNATEGTLLVDINSTMMWTGRFETMYSLSEFELGYYGNNTDQNGQFNPAFGIVVWSNSQYYWRSSGWFVVDAVNYTNGRLNAIKLRFQFLPYMEVLNGAINWAADNPDLPGPVYPPPSDLWTPPADALPSSGNYAYLQSQSYNAENYSYTVDNAVLSFRESVGAVVVNIVGNETWNGTFAAMTALFQVEKGLYTVWSSTPSEFAGGMLVTGSNQNDCWEESGWFVVDAIAYSEEGQLSSVKLRFEQQCGYNDVLYGALGWAADNPDTPPGPVNPPPPNLWQPAQAVLPSSGNYFYIDSACANPLNTTYIPSNSILSVREFLGVLSVQVNANVVLSADFSTMISLFELQPGYYGKLEQYPNSNPARGGISLQISSCSLYSYGQEESGWFVVDSSTYEASSLVAISLRFEILRRYSLPIHGALRWAETNPSPLPAPTWPPPSDLWKPVSVPDSGNYVLLQSQQGDSNGSGENFTYTSSDADITFTENSGLLNVTVAGNQDWEGFFLAMTSRLIQGYYGAVGPSPSPDLAAMSWTPFATDCQSWFVVDSIAYDSNQTLTAISIRFEQVNTESSGALYGALNWAASNPVTPPGPVYPPPSDLWKPPTGVLPEGNYAYLESYYYGNMVANNTYSYANSVLVFVEQTGLLTISVYVDTMQNPQVIGLFQAMQTLNRLAPGYYGSNLVLPGQNPTTGGLSVSGYYNSVGWFSVDSVAYDNENMTAVELRFLVNSTYYWLYGAAAFNVSNPNIPPGPVFPVPTDLWQPPTSILSLSSNYLYLNFLNEGNGTEIFVYLPFNSLFSVSEYSNGIKVNVGSYDTRQGVFTPMYPLSQLQEGYYANNNFPSSIIAKGQLQWGDDNYNWISDSGWFAIDHVCYNESQVVSLQLRLAVNDNRNNNTLYAAFNWAANNSGPPGPVYPVPSNLWKPDPGSLPSNGTYVYLEASSDSCEGLNITYTPQVAQISIQYMGSGFIEITVEGNTYWSGTFRAMENTPLEVGYYPNLNCSWNQATGQFCWYVKWNSNWQGQISWVALDSINYTTYGELNAFEMRFEQNDCGVIRGAINWAASNPTPLPPGPVYPPPSALWRPDPSLLPSSGNFLYLESLVGDPVGGGLNYTYTAFDSILIVSVSGVQVEVTVEGDLTWRGSFVGMSSLTQLELGYYGEVGANNPVLGSLLWYSGYNQQCDELLGWFAIDSLQDEDDSATVFRFEQYCNRSSSPLRGFLQWNTSAPLHPPGPMYPPPADLWEPPAAIQALPAPYIYLESQAGDPIGLGLNYTITTDIWVSSDNVIDATADAENQWYGYFIGEDFLSTLVPGYYSNIAANLNARSPIQAGFIWYEKASCETVSGWFVVDEIAHDFGLNVLQLRFEQHCNETAAALYGAISWNYTISAQADLEFF